MSVAIARVSVWDTSLTCVLGMPHGLVNQNDDADH